MTVLDDVLEWSQRLEEVWLRDALRRLVVQGALSVEDRRQLFEMFETEIGLPGGPASTVPIPLAANHLPNRTGSDGPVSITRIGPILGVNALAPGETICLEPSGVNVIYGRNASGKSGYSRVLKKACRARDSEEQVLGNVFSETPAGQQRAEFELMIGSSPRSVVWTPETEPDETASVAVFDARCARLYLDKAGEIACLPYGLDVFGDLCGLMDEFANQLDEDKKRVEDDLAVLPAVAQETSAKRFLDGLTAGTTDAEIVAACKFDEQKADRLEKLRLALAKNPQDEAKRLLRLAVRLRNLQQSVETIEKLVGGETPKVTALLNTVEVARKAVNEASALVFDDPLLDGVGSDPWRVLFDAAEKYSISEAYKGKEFPYVGDDARCVLCQQPLSHDAKGRFDKFKKFVSDAAGRALKEAEREVNTHSTKLFTHLRSIGAAEDALVDEVAEVDEPLRNALVDLRAACRKCVSEEAAGLPGLDTAALGKLLERLSSLEVTASQLDVDAEEVLKRLDADERSKRDREVSELEASKVLAANEASVVRRRDQLTVLMSNRHAKDSLRTNAVTEAGKQIAESAVTSELHESWGRALEGLGLVDPPVKMKKSTSKGSYKTSFELIGCSRKANMTDVLSEGEQRVIALAAFIAELSLADHANAVVFDDPVSSLDHNHRGCVAESIVGLAEQRQVIVFTHDLVFLKDLDNCCEKAGLTATIRGIHRESSGKVGVCRPDSCPADLLPLREHLTALEAQRLELKAKHEQSGDSPSYRTGVQDWYGSLRDAWEKAVEETLFNGVVQTYVDGVKTLSLREVAVEDRDWEDVVDGMTRCSTHLHRMSAARNSPIPPPANLLSDLDALRAFQKRVKDRRKDLKNRRPAPPK